MTSKYLTAFLFVFSLIVTACGVETPPIPTTTPTFEFVPTATTTIIPSPMFTPTLPAVLVSPTPTFGPPAAVMNFYVKKAKCLMFKPTPQNPVYRFEIWYKLAWEDRSDNEDGFWLYRDGNRVAELPSNTIEYMDIFELVKGGRNSTYYVVAYNSAGQTKGDLLSYPNPC